MVVMIPAILEEAKSFLISLVSSLEVSHLETAASWKKSNVKAQLELFWHKKYLTIMFLLSKAHFVGQSMKTYILRSDILKNLEKNFAKLSF